MNITIRNVQKEDLPYVADIRIKGWQLAYKGIIDDDYLSDLTNKREEKIAKMEGDYMTSGFIVAECNKEIVGFCRYAFDNSFSKEIDIIDCEICAIYVKPDLKHFGIGTKMFNYVVDEFKKSHKSKMIIWCLKDNVQSKKFYTKMGGKIIAEKSIEIGDKQYKECGFVYDL